MESKQIWKPTRLEKLKPLIEESGIAIIMGVATMILSLVELISSSILLQIPSVYLIVFSIAFGLVITFTAGMFLYTRQTKQRQLKIKKLKEKERELFQSIESDISSLLGEGLYAKW